jgi:predicted RNA-binding protein with PUA-like domain
MQYWLIKSEPYKYSFQQLMRDNHTCWDGVRNFQARNNLRAMKVGDLCLYYHSNEDKAIVGLAKVINEAFADPTAKEGDWVSVDVEAIESFERPVTLSMIKSHTLLQAMELVKQMRLSVCKVSTEEFHTVIKLSKAQ